MQSPYKKDPVPVYEVPFDDPSLMGKANKNGSIIMNKDQACDPEMRDKILKHEKHHLKEMIIDKNPDGSPVLDYDDESVSYKGVSYSREDFDEGNKELPWEKEAYNENEDIDIIPNPDKLSPITFKKMGKNDGHADEDEVNMNESFNPIVMKKKMLSGYRGKKNPFAMLQDKGLINKDTQASHLSGPSFHEPDHGDTNDDPEYTKKEKLILDDPEYTKKAHLDSDNAIKAAYDKFTHQSTATFEPDEVTFGGNQRRFKDDDGKSLVESTYEDGSKAVRPFSDLSADERFQYSKSRQQLVDDAFWQSDEGQKYYSDTKGTGRYFNPRTRNIEYSNKHQTPLDDM